jgi:ribonuclease E
MSDTTDSDRQDTGAGSAPEPAPTAATPPPTPAGTGSADPAGSGGPTSSAEARRDIPPPPRRKPQIGDTMPAPAAPSAAGDEGGDAADGEGQPAARRRRRRGGRGRRGKGGGGQGQIGTAGGDVAEDADGDDGEDAPTGGGGGRGQGGRAQGQGQGGGRGQGQGGRGQSGRGQGQGGGGRSRTPEVQPVEAVVDDEPVELDEKTLKRRRGRERKGRPVGRYMMCVSRGADATHISVLEGRQLIEHYVSRPSDDVAQIHGNIYLGRVQNVLPGMEAAFIDIGTPKNAVLYRGDVQYDPEDIVERAQQPRIEQLLKARQMILCQVTKNPIAHKGARLTQEVSLPGRFVVLVPNSKTYGISKRLPENERKRLRQILDKVRPPEHGVIVRTAAENVTSEEIERDMLRLLQQWREIEALAKKASGPTLLYREPDMALRVIREEFNKDYRSIVIDDRELFEDVKAYVTSISPALSDRVQYYDPAVEPLPLFERHHVHEQLHRAIDRKVWLPSGGSLIIEHTEALTVIDVNTGKNVGASSLEATVFANNLEAAEEIARQLRLRDIGGIIVIDFVDMDERKNRDEVVRVFREALARDKTRTQVFDISELGLVEMTRKRIGEGLLESMTRTCPACEGRGLTIDSPILRS